MKYISNIVIPGLVMVSMSGCGIYNKYESKAVIPVDAYGNGDMIKTAMSEESIANMSWREFFRDPFLQDLIEKALKNNVDVNSARIAVEQSQISLQAARKAFFPSVNFSPSASLSSFDNSRATKVYNLPLQVDWQPDVFGNVRNQKRQSHAMLEMAKAQEESVRANVISNVAQQYCMLQMLDCQLDILLTTEKLWAESLETQKVLMENGKAYSTAVNQMNASYLNVKTQIVDVRTQIHSVQNAICRLLGITPQSISRSKWASYGLPDRLSTGVPGVMLTNRADVKAAERAMEVAFYDVNMARAAFYPNITLSGQAGWTNNNGVVIDPGKLFLNALASLTQPVFAKGKLTADLKISELKQQDVANKFVQTVVNAGNQVNEAMEEYNASREKDVLFKQQVAALKDAYDGTHELMNNGKASYLEVLTAQEALLQAQLNEAMNLYDGSQAAIALYVALGGATK